MMLPTPAAMAALPREFNSIQMRAVTGNSWKVEMRVRAGIAVAGEVLRRWRVRRSLQRRARRRRPEFRYAFRVFAERTRVDDGIIWIAVDVRIGRKNPRDSDGFRLKGGDFAHGVGVFRIAGGGHSHVVRK